MINLQNGCCINTENIFLFTARKYLMCKGFIDKLMNIDKKYYLLQSIDIQDILKCIQHNKIEAFDYT